MVRFLGGYCSFLCAWLLALQGWSGEDSTKPLERSVGLLRDVQLLDGVELLSPTPGKRSELGVLPASKGSNRPAWFLAQWNSRSPLTPSQALPGRGGATNEGRQVLFLPGEGRSGGLELGVDSRADYQGILRTNANQPWPHLLIEQDVQGCPPLSDMLRLDFELEVQLTTARRFEPTGYSPSLHAAQFQWVLTLQNQRRDSPGFGDFLWFVVPIYDDRHASPPRYVAADFADPSAKLIYNPGAAAFCDEPLRVGRWVRLQADLRPHLMEALKTAWAKGYLAGSKDPADYRVSSVNLGWEVPGLNQVAVRVRGMRLDAVVRSGL